MATHRNDDSLVRIAVLILGVIVLLPLLMMVFAIPMMGMMGGWGMGQFGGAVSPWWRVGTTLVWLVVFLGIGYLIYRAVVSGPIANQDSALEELRHAYARGDLSDEEFERRLERLERSK